jgi:DNA-binding CsgD family transcriptional regulator
VLDAIRELHAIDDLEALIPAMMRASRRLVPCRCASYNEINPHRRRIGSGIDEPAIAARLPGVLAVLEAHMDQHPVLVHYMSHPDDRRPAKISDFMSSRDFRALPLYGQMYEPLETRFQLVMNLPRPAPGVLVGLAVNRWDRDFAERDRAALNLLVPHLSAAYAQALAAADLRKRLAAAHGALEALPDGVALVDAADRIVLASAAGMGRLDRWAKLAGGSSRSSRARLPDVVRDWLRVQRGRFCPPAAADVARVRPPEPLCWSSPDGQQRMTARALPHPTPGHVLLLLDEHRPEDALQRLGRLGLTPREAEVLYWVAQGKTNAEVAMILGVSASTPKKHLERIYEKLGVETRTAAAERAIECVRAPG